MEYPNPNVGLSQFILEFTYCFGPVLKDNAEAEHLYLSGIGEDLLYRAYCVASAKGIRYPKHIEVDHTGAVNVYCICEEDYSECNCSSFMLPLIRDLDDYFSFLDFFNMPAPLQRLPQLLAIWNFRNGFIFIGLQNHCPIFERFNNSFLSIINNPLSDASLRRVAWKLALLLRCYHRKSYSMLSS